MKKWVCSVCGYVYEGEQPPVECPVCHVDGSKFIEQKAEKSWAAEHVVGVGKAFHDEVLAVFILVADVLERRQLAYGMVRSCHPYGLLVVVNGDLC